MHVYIEAHFKLESTGEYKRVEVKIDEDHIPWGVAKFLERRYGKIESPSFHFTREAEDLGIKIAISLARG